RLQCGHSRVKSDRPRFGHLARNIDLSTRHVLDVNGGVRIAQFVQIVLVQLLGKTGWGKPYRSDISNQSQRYRAVRPNDDVIVEVRIEVELDTELVARLD